MARAVRKLPMKCDGRFCSAACNMEAGIYRRQIQMLVFSERFEKMILEFTNALYVFVLVKRPIPTGVSRAWLPRHFSENQ